MPQPPLVHPVHGKWIKCPTMVISWLQHSVDETIVKFILWIDDATKILLEEIENFRHIGYYKCVIPCPCGIVDLVKRYKE
ncbi:hypothetical protein Lal_00016717 [Lupinus albus]|nr:hypothetical protein Lal_00016717 [Lupinus albus]